MEKIVITQEYLNYHEKYQQKYGPDTFVIMQVGDFWELYALDDRGPDLCRISEITNLTKTKKNKEKELTISNPYMCGFNLVALDRYLKMLLDKNLIIVQVSHLTPAPKVTRGVTNIFSPGTYTPITDVQSNHIVSIMLQNDTYLGTNVTSIGLCSIDTSTGTCAVYELNGNVYDINMVFDEAYRFILNYAPKEVLIIGNTTAIDIVSYFELERVKIHYIVEYDKVFEKLSYQNEFFAQIYGKSLLSSIENINMENMTNARLSMIILMNHINEYNKTFTKHLDVPEIFINNKHLILYNDAIQQLNILDNHTSNIKIKCLYDVVNHCVTDPGKRFMRYAICNPLNNIDEIQLRYDCTAELIEKRKENKLYLDDMLRLIADIHKLSRRIIHGTISPNDLTVLVESYEVIYELYCKLSDTTNVNKYLPNVSVMHQMTNFINSCRHTFCFTEMKKYDVISHIETSIFNPSLYEDIDKLSTQVIDNGMTIDEIGTILAQYIDGIVDNNGDNKEDNNNGLNKNGKALVGIDSAGNKGTKKSTKIQLKNNKKLGVYLCLAKSKGDILMEKLKGVTELKISDELTIDPRNLEFDNVTKTTTKIFFKDATINSKNNNIIHIQLKTLVKNKYVEALSKYADEYDGMFKRLVTFVSICDFVNSNAKMATMYNYCKPNIISNRNKSYFQATQLRHPVIERINNTPYVSHDVCLGKNNIKNNDNVENVDGSNIKNNVENNNVDKNVCLGMDGMLLTGTNMSGKSSIMRSIGLAIIMAQTGLYVAADTFYYYPYQQLFARLSNSDNIYKKQSSFSHEIIELTKVILRCNDQSIVLGDEVINSTEYVSGSSLVGATLITLAQKGCTFVFATHMHDIMDLDRIKHIENMGIYHLSTKYDEKKELLIFNRKLELGHENTLYGLLVAKFLMKNDEFIKLAYEIKDELVGEDCSIFNTKRARYCSDVYLHACVICNKRNTTVKHSGMLDCHHITSQHLCKKNGFAIGGQMMNDDANLIVLCKKCHYAVHHNKLKINGYLDTSNGRMVDFEIL